MLVASLVTLVVGWSALWWFARHEAEQTFAAWIRNERAEGRIWTCPNQSIGGYPLGIVLSCRQPSFRGPLADGIYTGTLAGLQAEARLYFPTNVLVTLSGPLKLQDRKGGAPFTAEWGSSKLTLRGEVPGDLDRGQIEFENLAATFPGESAPARVGRLEASFRSVPQNAVQPFDAETILSLTDAQIPSLDAALGNTEALTASVAATVTRFFGTAPTWPALLKPWREAGGQLRIRSLSLQKGGFRVEGDGKFDLDDERRPNGNFDARFIGLEPLAQKLGIPLPALQIGGALSALLGGKANAGNAGSAALALPIVAKDGRLWVGPVKTGVKLDPLY